MFCGGRRDRTHNLPDTSLPVYPIELSNRMRPVNILFPLEPNVRGGRKTFKFQRDMQQLCNNFVFLCKMCYYTHCMKINFDENGIIVFIN